MTFNINNFKNALTSGGARPSLFSVTLDFPIPALQTPQDDGVVSAVGANTTVRDKLTFMCKATSLPTSTVAPIEVPYFGRKVKFAGNRTFPEWTITIINDEDFQVRKAFESWLAAINTHKTNVQKLSPIAYQKDGTVSQYGKDGSTLRTYRFVNVFPSEISPIELNWGSENEVEEFSVTLQYDYWYSDTL